MADGMQHPTRCWFVAPASLASSVPCRWQKALVAAFALSARSAARRPLGIKAAVALVWPCVPVALDDPTKAQLQHYTLINKAAIKAGHPNSRLRGWERDCMRGAAGWGE